MGTTRAKNYRYKKALQGRVESMQHNPKKQDVGRGLWLHAFNPTLQYLLVSIVFGTVSSLHLTSYFYTCLTLFSLGMGNDTCLLAVLDHGIAVKRLRYTAFGRLQVFGGKACPRHPYIESLLTL